MENELNENEDTLTESEVLESENLTDDAIDAESNSDGEIDYEPNFTYEVKGEKKEFDERLRSIISSKEDEDYVRDILTKADGLDSVKSKYESLTGEYDEVVRGSEVLIEGYKKLKNSVESNDFKGLIESLGVKGKKEFEDAVIDYALELAEFQNLPQEDQQRIALEAQRDQELNSLRNRLSEYESTLAEQTVKSEYSRMTTMLDTQHSELKKSLADIGIDLANEVMTNGTFQYKTTGIEPTVEEAVALTVNKYKNFIKQPQTESVDNQEKPVLPRVRGTNRANVASKVSSLEDLKKLASGI